MYRVRAQSRSGGPSGSQSYLVRVSKNECMASHGFTIREVLACSCGGWGQLGTPGRKTLCKHTRLVLLLCRHAWKLTLVVIGPRRGSSIRIESPSASSSEDRPRVDAIEDFVEVPSSSGRSRQLDKPLVTSFANELETAQNDQLQGIGTRPVPSVAHADCPKAGRSRGANKIVAELEDIVDEVALQEMFKGYDRNADNATDINIESTGRLIMEMGAKQTHKLATHLINRALHEVVLTA